jgi:hypothetical protein
MPADFTIPLWLSKLGALVDLYFLANVGPFPRAVAGPSNQA